MSAKPAEITEPLRGSSLVQSRSPKQQQQSRSRRVRHDCGCSDRLGWLAMDGLCWFSDRSVHVRLALDGSLASTLWIAMLTVWVGVNPEVAMAGMW